jgi:hypothetical protein
MQWLRSLVARSPKRWLVIGKTLFLAGAILVVGAVFARAALIAMNSQRAEAKLPTLRTLAEAYPQYPTWVVPEGPVGYTVCALLVLAGTALTVFASDALKDQKVRGGAWW